MSDKRVLARQTNCLEEHSEAKGWMHNVEEECLSLKPENADIIHVHTTSPHTPKSYKVLTTINSIPVTMELDTRAGVTIVSETTWAEKLTNQTSKSITQLPKQILTCDGFLFC